MLILIKANIGSKLSKVTYHLCHSLMDPDEEQHIINTAIRRARNLTNSALTEVVILIIIITLTASMVKTGVYNGLESGTSSWMISTSSQSLSSAGFYTIFISIPLIQFFTLRWLWKYFIWVLLLFRISKAKLNLLPTHADNSGGLAVLLLAQRSFSLFFSAFSVVISGELIAELLDHPNHFETIRFEAFGFTAICLVLLLFPLLFFVRKLTQVKHEGLLRLGKLSHVLSKKFEKEWINELPAEETIEKSHTDPSLIFDYNGIHSSLQQLKVIPLTLQDIVGMAVILFVPFLPIAFIHFSVAELIQKIAGLLM